MSSFWLSPRLKYMDTSINFCSLCPQQPQTWVSWHLLTKRNKWLPDTCAYDSNDIIIKPPILLYVPMHSACDYSLPIQSSLAMMMAVIFEDMQGIPLAVAWLQQPQSYHKLKLWWTKCTLPDMWIYGAEKPVTHICSVTWERYMHTSTSPVPRTLA